MIFLSLETYFSALIRRTSYCCSTRKCDDDNVHVYIFPFSLDMSEVLTVFNQQKNIWHTIEFVIGGNRRQQKGKYH